MSGISEAFLSSRKNSILFDWNHKEMFDVFMDYIAMCPYGIEEIKRRKKEIEYCRGEMNYEGEHENDS